MSANKLEKNQPSDFSFNVENKEWAENETKKYPAGRQASAVLALLWRSQKQSGGWLSVPAICHVAEFLDMPEIRVLEIATFYSMFNLKPVGKNFIQLCGTTPCWLSGSDNLKQICLRHIGKEGVVSRDGTMSWKEVECLGACVAAPVIQINDDYYENLDPDVLVELLEKARQGELENETKKEEKVEVG